MRASTLLVIAIAVSSPGCRRGDGDENRYQGVVEYEERDLAFEVLGRLVERPVVEGQVVKQGDLLARLDDTLAKSARDARAAEAQATRGITLEGANFADVAPQVIWLAALLAALLALSSLRFRKKLL